jgi:hypothetical protein
MGSDAKYFLQHDHSVAIGFRWDTDIGTKVLVGASVNGLIVCGHSFS